MKKIIRTKPGAKLKPDTKSNTKPKSNTKSETKTNMKSNTKPKITATNKATTNKSAANSTVKSTHKATIKFTTKSTIKSTVKSTTKPLTKFNKKPGADKFTLLTVAEENELLKFLLAQMPQKGRNYMKSLLAHGQISVDGEVTTLYNFPLQTGQKVMINWTKVFQIRQPLGLKILFEDEYLVVIEKPAGMLSIATDKEKELTAYNILSEHIKKANPKNRIFVVHRLDKETSGVMMFAKSEEIKETLQNAWKEVVLERSYTVVVEGQVAKAQGTINSWLTENKALRMVSSNTPTNDSKKAITHYKVLEKNKSFSLLEVKLETGRKNQIRIHMQDLGHSVIGDIKYGGTKSSINRLGLHAHILAFKHPITNENMRFESPIPRQFLSMFKKK